MLLHRTINEMRKPMRFEGTDTYVATDD